MGNHDLVRGDLPKRHKVAGVHLGGQERSLPSRLLSRRSRSADWARHRAWVGRSSHATPSDTFAVVLMKEDGVRGTLVRGGDAAAASRFEVGHLESDTGADAPECRCGNVGCLGAFATPLAVAHRLGITGHSIRAVTDEV